MSKQCTVCGLDFPDEEFSGHSTQCKSCRSYGTKERRKTIVGLIRQMYNGQRTSSRKRQHPLPDYDFDEFLEWVIRQPIFYELYDAWRDAGYPTKLIPSGDRLDNRLPYTLNNIQLTTWAANKQNQVSQYKDGIHLPSNARAVRQLTNEGQFIAEYPSLKTAMRSVAGHEGTTSNIAQVCSGKWKSAYGFRWEWADPQDE